MASSMAAAVPMGAVLTTAFPGAGGSQKRVRPQRAHFYPSCFFDVLRLSSVLLCLSSKAKETRANYLSFFAFIFPPRVFLQSCVALRRAGAARHGQVKKITSCALFQRPQRAMGRMRVTRAIEKEEEKKGRAPSAAAARAQRERGVCTQTRGTRTRASSSWRARSEMRTDSTQH